MTNKNYLIIENNIVTNLVSWDGDTQTWQPPEGSVYLDTELTNAKLWVANDTNSGFELSNVLGAGQIGFTYDPVEGLLMTNDPKPSDERLIPADQLPS